MNDGLLTEFLMTQADDLVRGEQTRRVEDYLEIAPSQADELHELLKLAEQTCRLLSSRAEPDAAFREDLHRSLLAQARQQQTSRALGVDIPRRWIIGAAAVGSAVSVASLVAYFIRQRQYPAMVDRD